MNIIKRLIEKWAGLEPEVCLGCETLKVELSAARDNNDRLTQALIDSTKPQVITQVVEPQEDLKPISSKSLPWRARQQALENEDRQRARILRDHAKQATEELERKVGLDASRQTEEVAEQAQPVTTTS